MMLMSIPNTVSCLWGFVHVELREYGLMLRTDNITRMVPQGGLQNRCITAFSTLTRPSQVFWGTEEQGHLFQGNKGTKI